MEGGGNAKAVMVFEEVSVSITLVNIRYRKAERLMLQHLTYNSCIIVSYT